MTEPTYHKIRLVKGGPFCGLKVWYGVPIDPITGETLIERPAIWRAEVNGEQMPINDVAPQFADGTGHVTRDGMISESEYLYYCNVTKWAVAYSPNDPYATPRKTIDMNKMEPIKW